MTKFVEISTEGIFSRTFRNEKGNTDLCNPTGRELRESQDPTDWWVEYEDTLGGLHYGR